MKRWAIGNTGRKEKEMSKLYVAYGSNLNKKQMADRCPTAKPYGVGFLKNWELIYRGSKTGAYATIRKKSGCNVPVAVWEIQDSDERKLDIYEGYPRFYFKRNVMVALPDRLKKAMVYIMDQTRLPGVPSSHYINTIYDGYTDFKLDYQYLKDSLILNRIEVNEQ